MARRGLDRLPIVPDPMSRGADPTGRAHDDPHVPRGKPASRWAADVEGFSVHAGTTVETGNRFGVVLEQLLRYCASLVSSSCANQIDHATSAIPRAALTRANDRVLP
jgi:hypothetical protein